MPSKDTILYPHSVRSHWYLRIPEEEKNPAVLSVLVRCLACSSHFVYKKKPIDGSLSSLFLIRPHNFGFTSAKRPLNGVVLFHNRNKKCLSIAFLCNLPGLEKKKRSHFNSLWLFSLFFYLLLSVYHAVYTISMIIYCILDIIHMEKMISELSASRIDKSNSNNVQNSVKSGWNYNGWQIRPKCNDSINESIWLWIYTKQHSATIYGKSMAQEWEESSSHYLSCGAIAVSVHVSALGTI